MFTSHLWIVDWRSSKCKRCCHEKITRLMGTPSWISTESSKTNKIIKSKNIVRKHLFLRTYRSLLLQLPILTGVDIVVTIHFSMFITNVNKCLSQMHEHLWHCWFSDVVWDFIKKKRKTTLGNHEWNSNIRKLSGGEYDDAYEKR